MRIIFVNVDAPCETVWKGMTVRTAIFKEPIPGPVIVGNLNLVAIDKRT